MCHRAEMESQPAIKHSCGKSLAKGRQLEGKGLRCPTMGWL